LAEINARTRQAYNLAAQRYHERFHDEMNEKEYDRQLLDRFSQRFGRDSLVCNAGCGPLAHIGRYLFDKGVPVVGVDISDQCIELARRHNPGMKFRRADMGKLPFADGTFDGVISYYSIIDTPKKYVRRIFRELHRVLKPQGLLLVAVKAGSGEDYQPELLGIETQVWFTLFTEEEIAGYFREAGFQLEFFEKRDPYGFEIQNERIFAKGRKS
ncbi:MAG: methyltransferase domain-containing protein, partial [Acidobacteriota bacterium]|nr:methyltransferase domain-containing protein [Acidobacteriota bacterium]